VLKKDLIWIITLKKERIDRERKRHLVEEPIFGGEGKEKNVSCL
jgi:hypothetical protein